ncbi:hypothetical protein BJF93_01065 [Xaviernesmea oryzae]|uniref:Uncharacterized protein n=1 Tax=Xaviernesmea oryzae TaxID=464029 RepID=A0A1Q9B229_9HYPH|nr:hypothetical protein [Xaviernesmea oryzae]OLP62073.1 hypothetical protein BJF93_01065 [Xaviernesmea oryzae]SEL86576.1 hypothetical protein SAMN04487976_11419 [Xaviernesmea oryzae]
MSTRSFFFAFTYAAATLLFVSLAYLTAPMAPTVSMSSVELPKTNRVLPGAEQGGFLEERFG